MEAAFDVERAAFFHVLADDFCAAAPEGDVDESDFLAGFVFDLVAAVYGEADIDDGLAFWGVADFRVTGEVAHDHDFIEGGHRGK